MGTSNSATAAVPGASGTTVAANRHYPSCQSLARAAWIEDRKAELLDTEYFHLVFTVPDDYRDRYEALTGRSLRACPLCQNGRMLVVEHVVGSPRCPAIRDTS